MMNDSRAPGQPPRPASLCPACVNVHVITSDRGSIFYRCRVSDVDPRFPKYPPQPVLECSAFKSR